MKTKKEDLLKPFVGDQEQGTQELARRLKEIDFMLRKKMIDVFEHGVILKKLSDQFSETYPNKGK